MTEGGTMAKDARQVFEGYATVRLAADADTPSDMLVHVGTKVMVGPELQPIPTTFTADGIGGFSGYGRTASDGALEWVIATAQDELLRFVNRIPGAGVWYDTEARRVWRRAADDLRARGASSGELRTMLKAMYDAAVANHAAPPPA